MEPPQTCKDHKERQTDKSHPEKKPKKPDPDRFFFYQLPDYDHPAIDQPDQHRTIDQVPEAEGYPAEQPALRTGYDRIKTGGIIFFNNFRPAGKDFNSQCQCYQAYPSYFTFRPHTR